MKNPPQILDPILALDLSKTSFGLLAKGMERELIDFDAEQYRADFGSGASMRHRRILLRYGIPQVEILRLSEDPDIAIPLLTSHVLWAHFWRRADDLVDQPASTHANAGDTIHNFAQAFGYTLSRLPPKVSPAELRSICRRRIQDMMAAEESRRTQALPLDENWRRVSPFFIAYDVFVGSANEVELYKRYINLMIFAHDLTDLFDDARSGIKSLPLELYFGSQSPVVFRRSILHFVDQVRADIERMTSSLRNDLASLEASITLKHLKFVESELF